MTKPVAADGFGGAVPPPLLHETRKKSKNTSIRDKKVQNSDRKGPKFRIYTPFEIHFLKSGTGL